MEFFTSPEDLKGWVKIQESPDLAATKIIDLIGADDEQDVVDTCRAIYNGGESNDADNASKILFGVLAKHNLTEITKEGQMKNDKMKREAQIMRQPGEYNMPLRICPKLPFSVGKRLISTYNCRHYCLDSIVFDDDPLRVFCGEALWRRHVMDKFSREWKDKEGKWVGGYINERFQVSHDQSGNQMELANDERTRKPRPHQYSIERRLSEGRGEETYDLTASSKNIIRLASTERDNNYNPDDDKLFQMFSDIIEMKESGVGDEDVLSMVSDHYGESIFNVAKVHKLASKELQRHNGTLYACVNSNKLTKKAQAATIPPNSTMVSKSDVEVINLGNGQKTTLKMETPVVMVESAGGQIFQIVGGPDAGQQFKLSNASDSTAFGVIDGVNGSIQEAADELGLNETTPSKPSLKQTQQGPKEFPINVE